MIKKEAVMLEKEMKKLALNFDGVKDMKGLPDALFVVDVESEKIAVQEALKMGTNIVLYSKDNRVQTRRKKGTWQRNEKNEG